MAERKIEFIFEKGGRAVVKFTPDRSPKACDFIWEKLRQPLVAIAVPARSYQEIYIRTPFGYVEPETRHPSVESEDAMYYLYKHSLCLVFGKNITSAEDTQICPLFGKIVEGVDELDKVRNRMLKEIKATGSQNMGKEKVTIRRLE